MVILKTIGFCSQPQKLEPSCISVCEVKKRLKKSYQNPISKVKVKSLYRVVHLVPQYNQTCIMTIPVLLANNFLHPHRNEMEGDLRAQQFIAVLVAYIALKGWSSIPVRRYKGISTPVAMIECLSHSKVLKYTVLTTYPCYNKHIFLLHSHFIRCNFFS